MISIRNNNLFFAALRNFFKVNFERNFVGFVLVLACVFSQNVNSQIISWDFTSGNTPNTNLPGGTTALSFNTGGTLGTSGCSGFGYSSNGWNVGEYLQIVIPLSGYELTTITFKVQSSGTGPGNFKVQYSSTGTSGTFSDLASGTFTSGNGSCVARSFDLSAINQLDNNANTVIRLVFTGGQASGSPATGDAAIAGTFRIDDLIINGNIVSTPCSGTPSPGNTVASPTSVTSGSSTALSLQNATSGSGVTYQWYSSTTSATGPWTAIGTSAATLTATPAALSTWYYCAVTCSGSTGNSTPVQVTATYCTPTGSTSYYLTNITTTGGITNINNTTTNSAGGYGNYSATLSTSNYPEYTTNISMTPSSSTNYYYCWIDWNNDLDFLDAGEAVITSTASYLSSFSGTITVPAGQAPGTYRMRVANSWLGTIAAACGPASYGEFEDYSFIVVAQTPCSSPTAPGNTLASVTSLSAGATTNLSLQNATSGTGVTYQWYSNTTNSTSGGTLISGATSASYTATVTGSTWYYCAVNCSGTTTNSNPVQVVVNYCTSNLYTYGCSTFDDYINSLTVSNLTHNGTLCTGTTGIVNYTSLMVNFTQGNNYTYTITTGAYSEYVGFWIDFNDNGSFGDAGEFIGGTTTSSSSYTITGTVSIPSNAAIGNHRMRVRLVSGTVQSLSTSCTNYSWGETHDYTANIVAVTPCSGTPIPGNTIASATSVPSGTTVNLSLQNATTGSGLTYQWYSSTTSATGPWTTIGSATNATYSTAVSVQTWFYCVVTCAGNGGTSSTPVGVTVTLTPNVDCSSAIQLCSDSQVNGASSGAGIADLTISTSGCLSYSSENQSNWFYSQVSTTGVFSFTITPANGTDDYDFAVWRFSGTPATCPPQAQPDRCSFAAVGGNTGLGNNATDVSEGTSGDRWVSPMNVNAGDYLLILVNNYSATYSPFTMDFTGTSGLNCNPVNLQCNISGTTNACIGSSSQLTGSGSPATSTPWTSSSPSVATVSNTGVVSGLSAGTTTITYVNSNGCSTSVLFTVSSTTINISNITTTVCSGNLFTVSPTNGTNGAVPAGTTYTWSAPSGSNVTGGAAGSGASTINGTLTLSSVSSTTAVYTVTPSLGSCSGNTFTVTVNLSDCTTAAPFTACNLVVYTIGDGTTSLSGNSDALPVRLLEISQSGTLVQSISTLFTGVNLLAAPGSAVSQGFLNSYNGITAVPGLNLNVNTTNSNTNNNKVTELINGGVPNVVTRVVHPTSGTMPFTGDNYRSVIPTSSTTFYAAGSASNSTNGVWYYNGSSFNQLVGLTARNVEIFNNQLYVSQSSAINEVGTGTPTSGTQVLNQILTYTNASIYDFSISPDGCTMYVADNGSSSYRGVTKWTKSTINGTWTAGINYPCYGYGLAVDYSGSSHIIYLTLSITNATAAPNQIISLTDNGSFTLNWTYTAASNYRLAGIDFTPNSATTISNTNNVNAQSFSVCQNGTAQTLTVASATSSNALSSQWYSNTTNNLCGASAISGTTNSTYTPPVSSIGTTYYFDKISSSCASTIFSSIASVTVNPNPTASITPSTLCQGSTATLTASGGGTHLWTPGGQTTNQISINAAGTYSVTVTDSNGCTNSASTTISVSNPPYINAISPP